MNSVAFIVIAILTLAAALAAATLQKLMHAALSFAVTFVGIAAFFFLLGAEFVGLVLQLERCCHRHCRVRRFDLGDFQDTIGLRRCAGNSGANC